VNVRIPETPTELLKLIGIYSKLADIAEEHGYPWPDSLEAWSAVIDAMREPAE
jgi:hypothetical protein